MYVFVDGWMGSRGTDVEIETGVEFIAFGLIEGEACGGRHEVQV